MRGMTIRYMSIVSIVLFSVSTAGADGGTMFSLSPGDDIQAAIDAAVTGDTIEFSPGTYTITNELYIYNKGITLQGIGNALNTTIQRDAGSSTNHRILFIEGPAGAYDPNVATIIDGLTLQNGVAPNGLGGNVYVKESPYAVIQNCIIQNGYAGQYGGGIDMEVGGTLLNSVVQNNTTANGSMFQGGGVYLRYGGSVIENSIICNNWADVGGGVAIQNSGIENDPALNGADSRVRIINSTIADNYADGYAGMIFGGGVSSQLQGKEALITDSIVWDNMGGANTSNIYNITISGGGTLTTTYTDTEFPNYAGLGNFYTVPLFAEAGTDAWDYYRLEHDSVAMIGSSTGGMVGAVLDTSYFQVPEPATMSLLALSGVALLKRKK